MCTGRATIQRRLGRVSEPASCCHFLGHGDKGALGLELACARESHILWFTATVLKFMAPPGLPLGPNPAIDLLGPWTHGPAFYCGFPHGCWGISSPQIQKARGLSSLEGHASWTCNCELARDSRKGVAVHRGLWGEASAPTPQI